MSEDHDWSGCATTRYDNAQKRMKIPDGRGALGPALRQSLNKSNYVLFYTS